MNMQSLREFQILQTHEDGVRNTHRAHLEIGAEARVADETLLILLEAEIVAKERAVHHAAEYVRDANVRRDRDHDRLRIRFSNKL